MSEKRWLYFALGVTTVISFGAVTNQLAPAPPPQTAVALDGEGITFADGSKQTTAALAEQHEPVFVSTYLSPTYDPDDELYKGTSLMYTVPGGKELVIETVGMVGRVHTGYPVQMDIRFAEPGGTPRRFILSPDRSMTNVPVMNLEDLSANEMLKIRLPAGGSVECGGESESGMFSFRTTFSGYLIDVS